MQPTELYPGTTAALLDVMVMEFSQEGKITPFYESLQTVYYNLKMADLKRTYDIPLESDSIADVVGFVPKDVIKYEMKGR